MYIGALNKFAKFSCHRRGMKESLPALPVNNMLQWSWQEAADVGIDITAEFDKPVFVEKINMNRAPGTPLKSVTLYNEKGDIAGKTIISGDSFEVSCGMTVNALIISLETDFFGVKVSVPEILGAVYERAIYPIPQTFDIKEGKGFAIDGDTVITGEDPFVSDFLAEEIERHTGIKPIDGQNGGIILKKKNMTPESYEFTVTDRTIEVCASDRLGFLYGITALFQLCCGGTIAPAYVSDSPYMKFRGFHGGLPSAENIGFYKDFIRYVLVPMRYNTIFIQPTSAVRYDRHPEINEAWLKECENFRAGKCETPAHYDMLAYGTVLCKEEVKDLIAYIRSFGLQVIPEIQSLGHVQYLTRAFPEIGETEQDEKATINLKNEDERAKERAADCYCPSNPKSYEYLFDVIDEIAEVFAPLTYIHMGHDEVYHIGVCPKCRDLSADELYLSDINKIHDYLAKKGITMMIWSDMIQESSGYATRTAADRIPKDIIMLDFIWYFHFDKDIEQNLIKHGLSVIMGNMYSSHYPRFETRRDSFIGAQTSTWIGISEYSFAREGKIFESMYAANMMWSKSYSGDFRRLYTNLISKLTEGIKADLHHEKRFIERVSSPITLPPASMGKTTAYLCSQIDASSALDGDAAIKANGIYDEIAFLHTADKNEKRVVWQDLVNIGEYRIIYEDGETQTIPVEYGGNIREYNKPYAAPMEGSYYRHQGYIATYFSSPAIQCRGIHGEDITIYRYLWKNPHPDKKIIEIRKTQNPGTDVKTILFGIDGYVK
ncbi:MAG: family 20 glycosylhydrolase [Eubacteriales bacterium]|jgi:hexosaminidase|nr:family 20 glycosylhydrolase [Eubacteriales bacterium]